MHESINRFWGGALILFAAHNLEETITIANGWAIDHLSRLSWTVERWPQFAGIAAALTLAVGWVAWRLRLRPERSAICLRIFLWIMLLNAVWHIGVSAYTQSLAPGVVSAVLLILPVYAFILYRLSQAKRGI